MLQLVTTKELKEAESNLKKKTSEAINQAMTVQKITRYELSKMAEISELAIQSACKEGNITLKSLAKICRVLKLNIFIG